MAVEPPCPGNEDNHGDDTGPCNVGDTWGWVAKAVANVRHKEEPHIDDKCLMADTVAGAAAAYI
jgi:hypothetical protein